MPIYKIADLNIEINPKYEKTSKQLAAYITDEKTADFCVEAEQSEIDRLVAGGGIDYLSESCIINTLVCREILDNYDGLFFHSSALMFDGKAYIFSAPSGTGKSKLLTRYAGMSGLAFWTNIMFVLLACARGWAALTLYKTQEETL